MQTESSPMQAPKKSNLMLIVVVILVLALAGAGYWGFSQSSALKATQTALATLQGQYDSLTAEKNKLSTDFDATKAELETTKTDLDKTKGDLATTQGDLKNSQDQGASQQAKIDKARELAEILNAYANVNTSEDFLELTSMIEKSNNKELQAEWKKFTDAPTAENSAKFMLYLITAIGDALK